MCTGQWEHTENNMLAGSGDKCHTEVTFGLGWGEGISRWMSAQGVSMSETPCSGSGHSSGRPSWSSNVSNDAKPAIRCLL